MRRRRFTLLELMVALAVLALALGVVLPRLDLLPLGLRIRQTTNSVNSAFYTASAMAQTTGNEVTLRFEVSDKGSRIRISKSAASALPAQVADFAFDDGEPDPLERRPPSVFDDLDVFPLDDKFALDEERLEEFGHAFDGSFRFYANGEADGPELPFTISGVPFTLTVDRLTGRPTVTELEEE